MKYSVYLKVEGFNGYLLDASNEKEVRETALASFRCTDHYDLGDPECVIMAIDKLPFSDDGGLATYDVSTKITGVFEACVEAESEEEAEELAMSMASEADFGEITDISLEVKEIVPELEYEEEME